MQYLEFQLIVALPGPSVNYLASVRQDGSNIRISVKINGVPIVSFS